MQTLEKVFWLGPKPDILSLSHDLLRSTTPLSPSPKPDLTS